jgi:hypothetical protein
MGTNTSRLQGTLKGVLVVVLCTAALTHLLSGDEWVPQEERILRSFMRSQLQVISAYSCENDCTSAAAGGASNCTDKSMPNGTKLCQRKGRVCMLVRLTGTERLSLSDLGSAEAGYSLPDGQDGSIPGSEVGLVVSTDDSSDACCRFDELVASGECGGVTELLPRQTVIIAYTGSASDGRALMLPLNWANAKESRIVLSLDLPTVGRVSHQIL